MSTYRADPARLLCTLVQAIFAENAHAETINKLRIKVLEIHPKDYWSMAAKAVKGYVGRKFATYFTDVEVEDLVAEVVTRMWARKESFDPAKGEAFPWIWTIAKNAVNDAAKAKHNRENVGGDWNEDADKKAEKLYDDYGADTGLLVDETMEDLLGRLRQERDRRILLYLAQELEYEEIAKREGLSVRAVYMAVFHLRQRLGNNNAA